MVAEDPYIAYEHANALAGRQSYTVRLLLLLGVSLAVLLCAVLGNSWLQALYAQPPVEAPRTEMSSNNPINPYVENISTELEKVVARVVADLAFLHENPFAHSEFKISDALARSQDEFFENFVDQLDLSLEAKEQLMPNVTTRFDLLREQLDKSFNASRGMCSLYCSVLHGETYLDNFLT